MLRPNFEDPLDTVDQLVSKNISIYYFPGMGQGYKDLLLQSERPEYRILGENFVLTKDWNQWNNITMYEVMGKGTFASLHYTVGSYEKAFGKWYKSKEMLLGRNNYAGFLSKKNWKFNEVSNDIFKIKC